MFNLLSSIFILFGLIQEPRVVTLAPSITKIVRELGVEPIGVSDYCEANAHAIRLGGLTNPNLEAIVKLKPDYVFLLGKYAGLSKKLAGFNIKVSSFSNDRISEVSDSVIQIAKLIGKEQNANAIVARLNPNYHLQNKLRVLLIVSGDYRNLRNLIAVGKQSIYGEILEKMGAENIYRGDLAYPSFSLEGILKSKPDRVIFMMEEKQKVVSEIKIPSVETKVINDPSLLVPGLNIAEISREIFEVLSE